ADGSALLFSTNFGGVKDDDIEGIALDSTANIYVAGYTKSTGAADTFPVVNDFQSTNGGATDLFVAKMTAPTPQGGGGGGGGGPATGGIFELGSATGTTAGPVSVATTVLPGDVIFIEGKGVPTGPDTMAQGVYNFSFLLN